MRFIDIEKLEFPEGWKDRAEDATSDIESSEDKTKDINDRADLWRELKSNLGKLSFKKCWYCEAREVRSDKAVDHFRPKGNIKDTDHQGYWWLAFDSNNYRYSCTFCNCLRTDQETGETKGKQDYFPLIDEIERAKTKEEDIDIERPELLDPTKPGDPGQLWFSEDGRAIPKYSKSEKPNAYKRAMTSIKLYHLDHTDLVKARKALAIKINTKIKDGKRYFKRLDESSEEVKHAFGGVVKDLIEMIKEDSEFSAFSRALLLGHRDIDWVDNVFQGA